MKNKMTRNLSVLLSLILMIVLCLTGCGGSDSGGGDEKLVVHFGSSQGTSHAWYEAAQEFAADVEEASDGNIEISIDFGGVWGSDKDTAESVQNGSLEMYIGSTVGADAVVNSIGFVNLPYLITTYEDVDRLIYNGWIGETIAEDMEANGYHMFGMTDCDFRWLSNSKHPIESAADMKNLKMRVPETKMFLTFFEELGAIPTSMAFVEVSQALQQKTIDGQDNGPTLSVPNGLHQFNKYWTKSNHSFAAAVVVYNQDKWNNLTAEQQEVLTTCADTFMDKCKELLREDVVEMEQEMKDAGCEVIEPTEQLKKDMQEAAYKVWQDPEATANFNQEAMARILKEAGLA